MIDRLAAAIAAQGRWALVLGLLAGLALPAAAEAVRPFVGALVFAVLFLAFLKIGPEGLRIGRRALGRSALLAVLLQSVLPSAVALAFLAVGWLSVPMALGVVLILAAAPITGAAPIAAMAGGEAAPALRQTVLGTLLLPLTVIPVFALVPAFGDAAAVLGTALQLLGMIALTGAAALALRHGGWVSGSRESMTRIDALAAILLAVVVVGLMSGAAEALRTAPGALLLTLGVVSALVFGLQAVAARAIALPDSAPLAVVTGNRNVALFLGVLPAELVERLLLVIGCYQVPMYLTPLVLPWILRRFGREAPDIGR